jgi:2-polyprenyl-3-methyl-5-hydroxy-6-metoxy-1,4-benzoquinol methylase
MTFANPEVLAFYQTLPFNFRESVAKSASAIRNQDPRVAYPVLKPLLRSGTHVLDVGCGVGWFANSVSHHCRCAVTGIDFNPVAIERASEVAQALGLDTEFEVADLFVYAPPRAFDLVVSLGVLHHTDNCASAVRRLCEFVKPGGHVFIGLYHKFGRQPFLQHFNDMRKDGASEAAMFARYKELHSELNDEVMLRSWFRDQVLHPHETQHTLEEIMPIISEAGMNLVSTSINRFSGISSFEELYAEERKLRETAEQRLKDNQYFTGFFVFLARKSGGQKGASIDTKPYVEHDELIGYRYIANLDLRLPRPGGGTYHFRTNSQGLRAQRDYTFKKPPETVRIILCGDSMSAGQFVSNEHRLSEQLERRVPGLEVINLSLEGSGTDQQLLLYEQVGLQYEHDAVILMPFLSNLRRNMVAAREGFDPRTGERVLRGKPRFEFVNGRLELRNVPVPKEVAPAADGGQVETDTPDTFLSRTKATLNRFPGMSLIKTFAYRLFPWEPFPEFRDANSAEWQLMAAIMHRFKRSVGDRPFVVVPTFYDSYVLYRMSLRYWERYRTLGEIPGIHVIDLLPHLQKLGPDAVRCFQVPHDMHFSTYGHLVVAEALKWELERLRLLPEGRQV